MLRKEKRSIRTLDSYEKVLSSSFEELKKAGLEVSPKKVSEREIDHLRENVYKGSERYNRWRLSILGTFLKWCGNGIIDKMRISWPQDLREHANWLTAEEALVVMNAAEGIERVIVHLELVLCMRRVEILRLRPYDFKGDMVNVLGKGRHGGKWRSVPYDEDTHEIIASWLLERQRIIDRARRSGKPGMTTDALLVHDKNGRLRAYQKTGIDKILARLKRKVESVYDRKFDFSNHTLRRTGGRMLWKAGVPIETICDILGHSDVRQTIKYLGINQDDKAEAMKKAAEYRKSLILPKKEITVGSQESWWAQGDLDS